MAVWPWVLLTADARSRCQQPQLEASPFTKTPALVTTTTPQSQAHSHRDFLELLLPA